jgi:catechol 2,3-dioxygenase-like lactoylglutathione lyase family enzyme
MIDHLTLTVSNLAQSLAFYESALAPLGYQLLRKYPDIVAFGDSRPYFWIKQGDPASQPMHLAFMSRSRKLVDAFHAAALAAGARDDGPPGIRSHYHANYYVRLVRDRSGWPSD